MHLYVINRIGWKCFLYRYKQLQLAFPSVASNKVSNQVKFKVFFDGKRQITFLENVRQTYLKLKPKHFHMFSQCVNIYLNYLKRKLLTNETLYGSLHHKSQLNSEEMLEFQWMERKKKKWGWLDVESDFAKEGILHQSAFSPINTSLPALESVEPDGTANTFLNKNIFMCN